MNNKECVCGRTSNEDGTCDGSHANVCDDQELDQNEDVPFADSINGDIEGGKALFKNCFQMVTKDVVEDLKFMDDWEDMAADVLKLFEEGEQ